MLYRVFDVLGCLFLLVCFASVTQAEETWESNDGIYGSSCYDQNAPGEVCYDSQTGGDATPEPVPEPGTLTLVLGGALLAARHYKKSHS